MRVQLNIVSYCCDDERGIVRLKDVAVMTGGRSVDYCIEGMHLSIQYNMPHIHVSLDSTSIQAYSHTTSYPVYQKDQDQALHLQTMIPSYLHHFPTDNLNQRQPKLYVKTSSCYLMSYSED